jgi:sulfite reductase alpha subunit-like flavoprotein
LQVRVAFSREGERKYVTHHLKEDRYTLWQEYLNKGAVVYVCGTINAANDVRATIEGIVKEVWFLTPTFCDRGEWP